MKSNTNENMDDALYKDKRVFKINDSSKEEILNWNRNHEYPDKYIYDKGYQFKVTGKDFDFFKEPLPENITRLIIEDNTEFFSKLASSDHYSAQTNVKVLCCQISRTSVSYNLQQINIIKKIFPNIKILDLQHAVKEHGDIKLPLDFLDFKSNNLKILDLPFKPFFESEINMNLDELVKKWVKSGKPLENIYMLGRQGVFLKEYLKKYLKPEGEKRWLKEEYLKPKLEKTLRQYEKDINNELLEKLIKSANLEYQKTHAANSKMHDAIQGYSYNTKGQKIDDETIAEKKPLIKLIFVEADRACFYTPIDQYIYDDQNKWSDDVKKIVIDCFRVNKSIIGWEAIYSSIKSIKKIFAIQQLKENQTKSSEELCLEEYEKPQAYADQFTIIHAGKACGKNIFILEKNSINFLDNKIVILQKNSINLSFAVDDKYYKDSANHWIYYHDHEISNTDNTAHDNDHEISNTVLTTDGIWAINTVDNLIGTLAYTNITDPLFDMKETNEDNVVDYLGRNIGEV